MKFQFFSEFNLELKIVASF